MKKNEKGYTIIELVLVISLLSFLAVSAFSTDTGSVGIKLDGVARKIIADLRYAQSLAQTTGVSHGFQALSTTTYKIYNVNTGTTVTSPYHGASMLEDLATDFDYATLSSGSYQIIFNNYGKPTTGGGTSIQVNLQGSSRTIQIASNSGYIYLQ